MCSSSNTKRKIEHWQVITLLLMIYDFVAVILSYGLALWVRFDCKMSMVEQKYFVLCGFLRSYVLVYAFV